MSDYVYVVHEQATVATSIALTTLFVVAAGGLLFRITRGVRVRVVYDYLVAMSFFGLFVFILRIITAALGDGWSVAPLFVSYILLPVTTFCLAQAGVQLVLDWYWTCSARGMRRSMAIDPGDSDIPADSVPPPGRSRAIAWVRHVWLSIAFVLALFNIFTQGYVPLGKIAAIMYIVTAVAIAAGAVIVVALRRGETPSRTASTWGVRLSAPLIAALLALALGAEAAFVFLIGARRYWYGEPDASEKVPFTEIGVALFAALPALVVTLPFIFLTVDDPLRVRWFRPKRLRAAQEGAGNTLEMGGLDYTSPVNHDPYAAPLRGAYRVPGRPEEYPVEAYR